MQNTKGLEAVIFDMDGVIFDSERLVLACWVELAAKYGIRGIEEAMYECLGTNAADTKAIMLRRYGADFPYERFRKEASAIFHERYDNGRLPMKKGVVELLEYLAGENIKIALASSTRQEVVRRELRDAGILPFFGQVICGDMVKRSKPAPDIYLKACEALGVIPQKACAIEDSYNGIRSAHSAGLTPIMVPDLSAPTKEMEQLAAVILPDLSAVQEYLALASCQ
ncbi:MAG: HAD family phosphatase [Lachnospiraceae bacterium]|nr:HAD family phosphatase [Lachnospiraceae bacterium]